ncbi:MAG: hypothetical protein LBL65_08080 [Campylobacteraceae bacterium]|jgi:hypothetical protein|nr:hypothetical protein [Campylobacteraceae bacterium]
MRFMTKVFVAVIAAGLFCSTLVAVEDGIVMRLGFGSVVLKEKASASGLTLENSDRGAALDIYGGYRMQNAQFGLSYTSINCDGCSSNYILASGAYVFENVNDVVKPFLGLGLGSFNLKTDDGDINERGLFGTANLGVNVEFDHFFTGVEFRQRIFGKVDKDYYYSSYNISYEANPAQTYLFYVGYKF